MKSLESHEVEYGYFEGDIHNSSGLDMAYLVGKLEEDRPFMEYAESLTDRHFAIDNRWKRDVWGYLCGTGTIIQLLKSFGKIGEKYVQASIDTGDWLPNAEWWRQAKIETYGSTSVLIQTGEMYESVKSKVRKVI